MKKLLATLLVLVMALSIGSAVFAAEPAKPIANGTTVTMNKTYNVTGAVGSVHPVEELRFTSTNKTAPEGVTGSDFNLTIENVTTTNPTTPITITLPRYTVTGNYSYEVEETYSVSPSQAVTYKTFTVNVQVRNGEAGSLVCYVNIKDGAGQDGQKIGGDGAGEDASLKNDYKLGSLKVAKQVTGNLGDKTQEFDVTVTLEAKNFVNSDLVFPADATPGAATELSDGTLAKGWTGTKIVTLHLHDGEDWTINNIPAGVTYNVTEDERHKAEDLTHNNPATGYTISYNKQSGTIADQTADTVTVTNHKDVTEIDTGVNLDNLPYLLLLAGVVVILAVMFVKKRTARNH